ncbi:MAG: hypothetical protein QXD77_02190 [Candidatus Aenigmatarchaeota archaeon]
MKGFAATPVIFIAVFLITVMLFLHFMDIDKQVAEGVGGEARLRKLQAEALKNRTAGVTELHSCMLWAAQFSSDETDLERNIDKCLNRAGTDVRAESNGFSTDYKLQYNSGTLIDADLNTTLTVSERINYPFFELRAETAKYARSMTYSSSCASLESDVYAYISGLQSAARWGHNYTQCEYSSGMGKNIKYMALENWFANTLSESYHSRTGLYGGACDC